jgi:hypothetical protein
MRFLNKRLVALAVGIYDTSVGIWPLISMNTFTSVTGLAGHDAIVKAIGASWSLLGIALLISNKNRSMIPPLGIASTIAGSTLAIIQCILVANRVISPIFLIQALAETTIGLTWILTLTMGRDHSPKLSTSESREMQLH